MEDKEPTFPTAVEFMSRHFVALHCVYETLKPDGTVHHQGTIILSGFVLEMHGLWFWVTAGHCLRDTLDQHMNSGVLRIVRGGFIDSCHLAQRLDPYPFIYRPDHAFSIEEPETGLDYAFIALDSLMIQAFKANNVVPVTRSNWEHIPALDFEAYAILGVPEEQVTGPPENSQFRIAMCPVDRIAYEELESPPPGSPMPSPEWFIGCIRKNTPRIDIRGMSGGPIYGFRRLSDGQLTYHVVALQSRWWPDSRTVFGCPMNRFAEEAYQGLKAALERRKV